MKKNSIFLIFMHFILLSFAQKPAEWGLRIGFSTAEDKIGFGASYYPAESKWFHHAEVYPIQNRGSDITLNPRNFGFLVRSNYKINRTERKLNYTAGAELYYSWYKRIIAGTPNDVPTLSQGTHLMATAGLNYRIGKRINLDLTLPVAGVLSDQNDGDTHISPAFIGFYGFFLPKAGVQVSLF